MELFLKNLLLSSEWKIFLLHYSIFICCCLSLVTIVLFYLKTFAIAFLVFFFSLFLLCAVFGRIGKCFFACKLLFITNGACHQDRNFFRRCIGICFHASAYRYSSLELSKRVGVTNDFNGVNGTFYTVISISARSNNS